MSLLTQLIHGQISPAEFITKAAAEIKKDAGFFASLPFGKTIEGWAVDALGRLLAQHFSPTIVELIVSELKEALGLTSNGQVPPAAPPGGT